MDDVSRATVQEERKAAREHELLEEVTQGDERAWSDFLASWRYWREADRGARELYDRMAAGGVAAVTDDEVARLYFLDARQARRSSGRTNALRCFEAMRQKSWKARHDQVAKELAAVRRELSEQRAEGKETLRKERIRMEAVVRREVTESVLAEQGARERAKAGVAAMMGEEQQPPGAVVPS